DWTNRSGSSKRTCRLNRGSRIEDRGSRIEDRVIRVRRSSIFDLRSSILDPQSSILLFPALFNIYEPGGIDSDIFYFDRLIAFEPDPGGRDQAAFHLTVVFDIKLDVGEWIIHRPCAAA